MKKILFVCHGNICRSPMAEFVLKRMVKDGKNEADYLIESAATSTEEIGNPVHSGTRRILAANGVCTEGKYAVQIKKSNYEKYDYIIGMDAQNVQNIKKVCGGDPENKISRLLDWTNFPRDIADPWYTGNFEQTYTDICEGCRQLLEKI